MLNTRNSITQHKEKSLNNKPLRLGIVGLGFGAAVHAPVFLSFSDVEVVGIVGRSSQKAKAIAKNLGISNGFNSIDELISQSLDAITISLPPEHVISAVDKILIKRIPVLCEKPFGTDYASSMAIINKHNVNFTTSVDFIFAELDVFLKVKEIIEKGTMGQVRNARMLWLSESWSHRNKTWSWKTDADQNGGVLSLLGSHIFFLAEWFFGPVMTVNGNYSNDVTAKFTPFGHHPAEDFVSCTFSYSSGAKLNCTFSNANSDIKIHRWIIEFDYGTVILENKNKDYTNFCMKIYRNSGDVEYLQEINNTINNTYKTDKRFKPFSRIARRFVNAVRSGCVMQPDLFKGARVQLLDNAVRIRKKTKKEVYL